MSIFAALNAYLTQHSRNIEADTVAHLKAFAKDAEAFIGGEVKKIEPELGSEVPKIEADAQNIAHEVVAKVETKVITQVEAAMKEMEQHTEHAFADLLAAQHPATIDESKQ